MVRHLLLHDPNNAEYQEALKQSRLNSSELEDQGDEFDEDASEFLDLQNASTSEGMQLTEIDGEQVQVERFIPLIISLV